MELNRVTVLGGGPGGLYVARLLKLARPDCDVVVYEQGMPDKTFGFGVGLAAGTQRNLESADAETLRDIRTGGFRHDMQMWVRGQVTTVHNNALIGIARTQLLAVLQEHAERCGVVLKFGERMAVADLDADLVIAADGVNSATRTTGAADFGVSIEQGRGPYLWAATDFALPHAVFEPVETEYGPFVTHAYPYQPDRSTFLIETDAATWRAAGLDADRDHLTSDANDEASLRYLEGVFEHALQGHSLIGNRTQWLQFRTVRAKSWHHDNVVLLGDAAHTAHYSIGSGTKLAMEDAIELVRALDEADELAGALKSYEMVRRPSVERLQGLAARSQWWWDSFPERLDVGVDRLMVAYMSRAGNVPLSRFATSSPDVVDRALREYADGVAPDQLAADELDEWVLGQPLDHAGRHYSSRIVDLDALPTVSDDADASTDGLVHIAVGAGSAWESGGDELVRRATHLADQGSAGIWLTGPAERGAVLDRLDVAERIRLATGLLTIVSVPTQCRADAVAGLVSARLDLVAFDERSAEQK